MRALIQFTPIADVTVEDDGSLTLEIDWSSSCSGEWDEAKCDHFDTDMAEAVCDALPELPAVTRVQIAGPGTIPDPVPPARPYVSCPHCRGVLQPLVDALDVIPAHDDWQTHTPCPGAGCHIVSRP